MNFTRMRLTTFRKLLWGTADGRLIPIGLLTDTHLANIIYHTKLNANCYPDSRELATLLLKEARSRKLSKAFLDTAPIPWQDNDGKWKRFNNDTQRYETIGR